MNICDLILKELKGLFNKNNLSYLFLRKSTVMNLCSLYVSVIHIICGRRFYGIY